MTRPNQLTQLSHYGSSVSDCSVVWKVVRKDSWKVVCPSQGIWDKFYSVWNDSCIERPGSVRVERSTYGNPDHIGLS